MRQVEYLSALLTAMGTVVGSKSTTHAGPAHSHGNVSKLLKLRAIALCALALFIAPSACEAGSAFDGTFAHMAPGLVEYFSLTQTGSHVAGFYQAEQADVSAPDGVKETRINVSGVTDGGRVNFRQGEGTFSTTLGWDARSTGDGFTLTFAVVGGLLRQNDFRSSSNDIVNGAIVSLRQSVGQIRQQQAIAQQLMNLRNEMVDATNRIQNDQNSRPRVLQEMINAKAALVKAQREIDAANSEILSRQANQDRLQADVDEAAKTATTPEEYSRVNDMRATVNDARAKLNDANADMNTANSDFRTATSDLENARRDLKHVDDRIAELHSIIRRDAALGGRI